MNDLASVPAMPGSLRLRNIDVPTQTRDIEQKKLQFYPDNPRIYSLVRPNGQLPDQDEIYKQLLAHEHVRELKEDIAANGGLMDPLIVRDGDLVVLEGNSRLAACRFLAGQDPIKWGTVRCTVLPADIDEKLVFALLGQYHIKGKKDWVPFEKAGFLYRRYKTHGLKLSTVATELGIGQKEATHLIEVYEFMLAHKEEERDRWSYYDEYLKSRQIKKARAEYSEFDDFIIKEIRSGNIGKAQDLRDKLPKVCASPKILKKYVEGKSDFDDAYDDAVIAGGENVTLQKLKKFRKWLALGDTEDELVEPLKPIRDGMLYELVAIEKRAKKLIQVLEAKKTKM
jgi:hypothetical protein